MLLNIDFDGVLVPNTHETALLSKVEDEELSLEDTSPIWDWYDTLIGDNPLPINTTLLQCLHSHKEVGDTIRLWTNRPYTLRTLTLNNLGPYASIFDSSIFYGGHKSSCKVEGVVMDNDVRNLSCGERSIHYEWR